MGSHCASGKAEFSGVSAVGYIYTHPAAQLLSFSQLQTAGEQRLPEGPFSHGSYSRFLWDDLSIPIFLMKEKRKRGKKKA